MADEIAGLTVKVGITDELFQQGVTKLNSSMKVLQSEFKASSESLKGFGTTIDQLSNKSKYLGEAIELQKAKVNALKEAFETTKSQTGEFSTQTANAGVKVNNASAYLAKLQNQLKETDEALEKTNAEEKKMDFKGAFEKAGQSAEGFKSKISGLKTGIMTIGATIAGGAGLYEFAKGAIDAGDATYKLQTRLGTTTADAAGLSKMLNLAGVDTGTFTTTITRMDRSVLSAGKSGNATTKALSEFGVKLTDAHGKMLPMTQQLAVLAQAYQKATETGNEDAFTSQVLGQRGAELIPILQNYSDIKEQVAQQKGIGIDPKQAHDIAMKMTEVKGQLSQIAGVAAKEVLPIVSATLPSVLKFFQDVTQQIKNNKPQIDAFVQNIIKVGQTVISIVMPPIKSLFNFISQHGKATTDIVLALGSAFLGFKAITTIISGITGAMKLWESATKALEVVQGALNVVMSMNPIGIVVIAIAGLVAGLILAYNKCSWFRDGVNSAFKAIGDFFTTFIDTVKNVFDTIGNVLTVAVELIASIFQGAITIITLPFQAIWENCKGIITTAWNAISAVVSSVIKTVSSVISTGFNAIKEVITTVWNAISGFFSSIFSTIGSVIGGFIDHAKSVISTGFNAVSSFIAAVWHGISSTISGVFNDIVSTIANSPVAKTAENIFNSVKNGISNAIDGAKKIVSEGLNAIKNFFSGLILKLPSIKLPHFNLKGSLSLNPPSVPSLGVNWYANGGIFNSPSVIGVGENGREAVMPLENNTGWIDELASKLNGKIGNNGNNQPLQIQLILDNGKAIAEWLTPDINKIQGNQLQNKLRTVR